MITSVLLVLLIRESYAFVCDPNQVQILSGYAFPPNGHDSSYTSNTICHWQIIPPQGKYIQLQLTSDLTIPDDLLIIDGSGLLLKYPGVNSDIFSPIPLYLEFKATTNGTFKFAWLFSNITYSPTAISRVILNETTRPSVLLKSEIVYKTPYVIQSSSPMIIQAASAPLAGVTSLMTSAFVFDGEGVGGNYLGSLYTFAQASYKSISSSTITVISVTSSEYGIALVKQLSAIGNYSVALAYALNSVTGTNIKLDGTKKPIAYTLYNPYDTDYYLTSTNFELNSLATFVWQTGDLRSKAPSIRSFQLHYELQFPQAIPGQLNTFIADTGSVSMGIGYTRPDVFDSVPIGTTTVFMSRNWPYINIQQGHQITYETGYPAMVNVSTNFSTSSGGNKISVQASDGNGVSLFFRVKFGDPTLHVFGNKFTFTYDNTTTHGGAGARITFQRDTTNGNLPTTTPKAGRLVAPFWIPLIFFSMLKL